MDSSSVADFFKREKFSDITLCFSGEKVKCHRVILASASDYFEKLLDPSSEFKARWRETHESTAKEIDLQDDDPRALRALLTYIYTFEYAESPEQKDDWRFHLAVYRVARKYMVKKLKDKAFAAFHYLRLTLNDMSQVLEVLEALYEEADDTLTQSADTLLQIHLKTLGDFEGFRAAIEEDKVLMWRYLDKLKAGLKPEPKPKQETEPGKVEMHWARCSCGWRRFLSPGQKVWPACGRRACSVTSAPAAQTVQSMWLRRKPDGTVDVPFV